MYVQECEMTLTLFTVALVALSLILASYSVERNWTRTLVLSSMAIFLQAMFILVIYTTSLRAHVEFARNSGASEEYIAGMIERDRAYFSPRVALGFCASGMALITILVAKARRERSS
jgi:hypothetical protein